MLKQGVMHKDIAEWLALTGADLRGAHGLSSLQVTWLNLGSREAPIRLEGEALKQWLEEAVSKGS